MAGTAVRRRGPFGACCVGSVLYASSQPLAPVALQGDRCTEDLSCSERQGRGNRMQRDSGTTEAPSGVQLAGRREEARRSTCTYWRWDKQGR